MKMDNVRIFEGNEVEIFELNEQILFNPRDVGKCLEISADGVRKAVTRMNKSQVIKLTNSDVTNCHIRKLNNAGENFLTTTFKKVDKGIWEYCGDCFKGENVMPDYTRA